MKKIFFSIAFCLLISGCASPTLEDEKKQEPVAAGPASQDPTGVAIRSIHSPIVSSAIQRLLISEKINELQSKALDKRLKQLPDYDYALIVKKCSEAIEELMLTRCDEAVMPFLPVD